MAKQLTIPFDLIRRLSNAAECTHLNDGELLDRFVTRMKARLSPNWYHRG